MLQGEHSAIPLIFIKLPLVIKIFVLSIFEWPLKTAPRGEHSAILLTFIKLPFVVQIFVLSIFEWPLKTDFTVHFFHPNNEV